LTVFAKFNLPCMTFFLYYLLIKLANFACECSRLTKNMDFLLSKLSNLSLMLILLEDGHIFEVVRCLVYDDHEV
jgi:hypothetical protein